MMCLFLNDWAEYSLSELFDSGITRKSWRQQISCLPLQMLQIEVAYPFLLYKSCHSYELDADLQVNIQKKFHKFKKYKVSKQEKYNLPESYWFECSLLVLKDCVFVYLGCYTGNSHFVTYFIVRLSFLLAHVYLICRSNSLVVNSTFCRRLRTFHNLDEVQYNTYFLGLHS